MENPSNYRVKVDLSQFYDDARKLSYVYVNEKSISHILHLHERIKDVFGITRPFYLTSNEGVYLPLNEDVRIIGGEETITLCPGSVNPNCLTLWKEMGVKCNGKPLSTIHIQRDLESKNTQSTPLKTTPMVTDSDACDSVGGKDDGKSGCPKGSVIVTESEDQGRMSLPEDSDTDATQDPKANLTNSTSDLYTIPPKKRRRGRKRKSKRSPEISETPKVINTPPKPISVVFNSNFTPKTKPQHFKFNWEDNDDETDTKMETTNGVSGAGAAELNTLLSLKNSQFPVTFVGQKTKQSDVSSKKKNCDGDHQSPIKNGNSALNSNSSKEIDFSDVNPLDYPISNQDFHVGDVVAFRILKMGSDYSPTVSGYIVAETVLKHSELSTYSFKIINGEDQLKNPDGKFSLLTEEEMENPENTPHHTGIHVMTKGELLELRLIHRKNT